MVPPQVHCRLHAGYPWNSLPPCPVGGVQVLRRLVHQGGNVVVSDEDNAGLAAVLPLLAIAKAVVEEGSTAAAKPKAGALTCLPLILFF